jgi:peptidoglycan hydrolase-like protein with peptidoglycan-binding domain
MSKITGVVFIAAGLATAGFLVSAPGPEGPQPVMTRAEPPRSPVSTVVEEQPRPASAHAAKSEAKPAAAPKAEIVLRPIEPPKAARAAAQGDDGAKISLARDIQRELRRVGCYAGDVTGEWSPLTKQAMKTFIDRVNASLPIDEPDFILKALVQGHPGNACGTGCGPGQSLANDGRCMPTATTAQATKRPPPAIAPAPPRPQIAEVPQPRASTSTWETRILKAPPEPAVPPPGRMAVGGPRADAPPALAAGSAPTHAGEPPLAGAIAAAQIEGPRRRPLADSDGGAFERSQGAAAAAAVAGAAIAAEAGRRRVAAAPRTLSSPPPQVVRPPVAVYRAPPRNYYYAPNRERLASQAFWRRVTSER